MASILRVVWLRGVLLLAMGVSPVFGADFVPPSSTELDPKVEARVDGLLAQLTTEEKIGMVGGPLEFYTQGVPRLGIPALKFSDGPVGVRCWGKSTAYPADVTLAATWDPEMATAMGTAIGRDARSRGVHVVLGPGANIYREAQNGRNFEYVGEDPFLASAIVTHYIEGLQSQDVAACIKHYVANEQEMQRGTINTLVSRRALEEIYFPPFRAAIEDAHVWTLMAAYNRVNGDWCTANKFLMTDILRDGWKFQGVAMSDWGACHDTEKDLNAGLDLEMDINGRVFFTEAKIKPLLDSGAVSMATLDEHVRRILRLMAAMGYLDHDQTDASVPANDPANSDVVEKVASEGIVLLKNEGQLLPLDHAKVKHLVVVGPNADPAVIGGGGSSGVDPFAKVSVLDGIKTVAGDQVEVVSIPQDAQVATHPSVFAPENAADGTQGMSVEYFNNATLEGTPVAQRVDRDIQFNWGLRAPVEGLKGGGAFSIRWKGTIQPTQSGEYLFATASDDGSRVFVDGKQVVDNWGPHGIQARDGVATLEQGHIYHVTVEYFNATAGAEMHFGWSFHDFLQKEKDEIAAADAVIYAGGMNPGSEHEGSDRDWGLPDAQVDEIRRLASINPHLIVAMNAGGNLSLGAALANVPALLWAWYPGQNGNLALAKIIFGDINPSGHLPDTFEKQFEDSPAYGNFPGDRANGGTVHLGEGIYVGYRWYDKKAIAPEFPFGFGLSYSTFDFKNAKVMSQNLGDQRRLSVSVDVTNSGTRDGAEVVQLYVRPVASTLDRPVQELKGFVRVELKAGETKTVTLPLTARDFATFDETSNTWITPPGKYEIALGRSSRDIVQTLPLTW